ncbi:ribosome hibernation-promoting factor, HPF/YfiA family [Actinomyces naeslundii]|uniref:ribosome hibernation-promoting factor, HPF/YfiA family n=1 Tax=Actinomyces naeslundii TaxID=1655 RepID=UPI00096BE8CE|nr:ribosome-associated translation inhibitor RaiA [Actinomyces naeslundii]OMG22716.1 ribosomal subunit interface protein [Actinomyces naeslundii]OMG28663.1 ribosomal subunit interface protein [Actinomyces naeslundii]OMG35864.1 ribosomal subunit interface protein [Actinomyces naeslundii]OMG39711.1 ribosomal subunit interface protein [Actinomyces naeslundii]BDH77477.1 ribosomal subunit interface protein [Actinomyces naeslundii]
MDITVVGRNAEISSRLRDYVEDKAVKVEQFDPRVQRVEVEVTHERNPRQADTAERVEITVVSKGPVIRAEASSSDRFAAFDIAMGKLTERLRRARDRKKDHRRYTVAAPSEDLQAAPVLDEPAVHDTDDAPIEDSPSAPTEPGVAVEAQLGDSPVIVRQKLHEAKPMTVDEALYQMELVGHPFYLFIEKASKQPCAVYHRHGWTYGVIRLDAQVL